MSTYLQLEKERVEGKFLNGAIRFSNIQISHYHDVRKEPFKSLVRSNLCGEVFITDRPRILRFYIKVVHEAVVELLPMLTVSIFFGTWDCGSTIAILGMKKKKEK